MCNSATFSDVSRRSREEKEGAKRAVGRGGSALSADEKKEEVDKEQRKKGSHLRSFVREEEKKRGEKLRGQKMALSSRLRPLLLAAVAALLLVSLAPSVLAANTLMAVDLGGEFMKVREGEVLPFVFFFFEIECWRSISSTNRRAACG